MKWVRTVVAAIVGVIAVVGLLLSVIGFWARGTVFDESEVAAAVESALDEPGVTDALAVRLTDSVMSAVGLDSIVNGILPPPLQRLTPAIVGGATQLVEQRLTDRLADPDTRARMVAIFERAYAEFLGVLEGDGLVDGLTVEDDQLVVNFLPLIGEGLEAVQRFGLIDDVTIPDMTRAGDASAQISELEQAFDRDLPDDFGQIAVYRSDSVARAGDTVDRAQQLLIVIKRSFSLILAVTVLAVAGALLIARERRRAALILLLSSAAVFVIARVIVNKVLDDLPAIARAPAGQAALAAVSTSLADGLVRGFGVGAVLMLLGALVVYLLDPDSAVRRRVAASTGSSSLSSLVVANRVAVMLIAFAAALLVLTIAGWNWISVPIAIGLTAIGLIAWRSPQPVPVPASAASGGDVDA
jgi:hypothetical protein